MPHKESDAIASSLDGVVPFFGGEVANAFSHSLVQAFLFMTKEVDYVHS
jgi:hypothetical protein